MVSIVIGFRTEIKSLIDSLINEVGKDQYLKALETLKKLEAEIFKFFSSRNIQYNGVKKSLKEIRWALTHGNVPLWKREENFKQIQNLLREIDLIESGMDMKTRILILYETIQESFSNLCSGGKREHRSAIIDSIASLRQFSKEISGLSKGTQKKYSDLMTSAGVCLSSVNQLPLKSEEDRKWIPKGDVVKSLASDFSQLYMGLEELLGSFDIRPDIEEKKDEEMIELDLKTKALQSRALDLLIRDWNLSQISKAIGCTIEEVEFLLGLKDSEKT